MKNQALKFTSETFFKNTILDGTKFIYFYVGNYRYSNSFFPIPSASIQTPSFQIKIFFFSITLLPYFLSVVKKIRLLNTFFSCSLTTILWKKLQYALLNMSELPDLIPQSAILGSLGLNHQHYLIINHLLIIFKFYIYKARDNKKMNFKTLKRNISIIRNIKNNIKKLKTT